MSRMIPPPMSRATGVGALPHTDPVLRATTCSTSSRNSRMPPRSRAAASSKASSLTTLPIPGPRHPREALYNSTRDNTAAMEQVYLGFVGENFSPYGLDRAHASAFAG